MAFSSEFEPGVALAPHHWVLGVLNGQLLRRSDNAVPLHRQHELSSATLPVSQALHIGRWRGESCFAVEFSGCEQELLGALNTAAGGYELVTLRSQLHALDDMLFGLAGRALQLLHWSTYHRFCGYCGAATQPVHSERALQCSACETLFYPKIAPCVIGVIVRGDQCLLARNARFREGMFSAIAGFIEPGETVEDALRREIHEEVGVSVDQLEYIGSQSWPFPSQLMLGYIAHYHSGEICVDGEEIVEAEWFSPDNLPQVPPPETISGLLIQTYLTRVRGP